MIEYEYYCYSCKADLGKNVIPPIVCHECGKRTCAIKQPNDCWNE